MLFPSCAGDAEFRRVVGDVPATQRQPGRSRRLLRMNAQIDVRSVLPAIHRPTLVLHSKGDRICPIEGGRFLARTIPDTQLVELPGADHHVWVTDAEPALTEIEQFLTGQRQASAPTSVLGTLLFTDLVGSTQTVAELGDRRWTSLLDTHNAVVRKQLEHFGGREIDSAGDGFLVLFDGPARAVRCALAIRDALSDLGLRIRAGVHTAEVELSNGQVRGIGVHLAARIMGLAEEDEVLVSRVVHDLALGSGVTFTEHGRHMLKGVPGEWEVLRVEGAVAGEPARTSSHDIGGVSTDHDIGGSVDTPPGGGRATTRYPCCREGTGWPSGGPWPPGAQ